MELKAANNGSYPRISDDDQRHRQAYAKLDSKEIAWDDFEKVQDEVTRDAIEEQAKAGLDIVTDGQIRWYDPVSHIARNLEGCEINGLLRFFDTNFYFRQPVIKGKISRRDSLAKEYRFASGVSSKPVKQVITGPYTEAKLSINNSKADFRALVDEFAKVIAQEVKDLAGAGAKFVQIDEPAILKKPADFAILEKAVKKISAAKGGIELSLCTYFGDAAPLYKKLVTLPVDTLSFDFTYSPSLPDLIAEKGCEKNLGLGIIDGRNTRLDDKDNVLAKIVKIMPAVEGETIYIMPSCGIGDYLPRGTAFKKLQIVAETTEKARQMK